MMRFHHIGVAVEEIDGFRKNLEELFRSVKTGPVTFDPEQNAYVCMAELPGGLNLELIQGKVVENFVKKGSSRYCGLWMWGWRTFSPYIKKISR